MLKNKNIPVDELIVLYKKCHAGKKKDTLRLAVIEAGMSIVKKGVSRMGIKDPMAQEDLIQIGALGLMKAIDNFDAKKNTKFSTYAYYFVKGHISHYLRDKSDIVRIPARVKELVYKVSKAYEKLKAMGESEITPEMLSKVLDVEEDKILYAMSIPDTKQILSLDQLSGKDEDEIVLAEKVAENDAYDFTESYEKRTLISDAVNELPDDMKKIIRMSFYEDLNQKEIAEQMGISQMQVSRLLKRALLLMYDSIVERT